jgi:hypothetical protein
MNLPETFTAAMAGTVVALLAWHVTRSERAHVPPDVHTRHLRYKLGWEVRGMVFAVSGPIAAAILFGRVPHDYAFGLLLFLLAGCFAANLIAPSGFAHAFHEWLQYSRRR